MARRPTTFGQIIVQANDGRSTPLRLSFTDDAVQAAAYRELTKAGYTVSDDFHGYQLFTSVAAVMETVKVFCKPAAR